MGGAASVTADGRQTPPAAAAAAAAMARQCKN